MLKKLRIFSLYITLKLGSFHLLFKSSALSAQRFGLERSKRNDIQDIITRMHVFLCSMYHIFWFYKNWVLIHCTVYQKIMKFTATHYQRNVLILESEMNY